MTVPQMSDAFAGAFRRTLVDHVEVSTRRRPRRSWLLGGSMVAFALAGGTAAAAATGLLHLPGMTNVTPVATAQVGTFTGSASLTMGPAPAGATGIVVSLHCLTPGSFSFPGGAGLTCVDADFAASSADPGFDAYLLPLSEVADGELRVAATAGARWNLSAAYATAETSDWATNSSGDSYGVTNQNGSPDLVAVVATNGAAGYVRRTDLEEADGTAAAREFTTPEDALEWQQRNQGRSSMIRVYESDGVTKVGVFVVG